MLNITSTMINDILTKNISVCYCGFWSPVRINCAKQCWQGSTSRCSFSDNGLRKFWNLEILVLSSLKFWSTMTYPCLIFKKSDKQRQNSLWNIFFPSPPTWNFDVSSNSKLREVNSELEGGGRERVNAIFVTISHIFCLWLSETLQFQC